MYITGPFNIRSAHSKAFYPLPTIWRGFNLSVSINPCSVQNKSEGNYSLPVHKTIFFNYILDILLQGCYDIYL